MEGNDTNSCDILDDQSRRGEQVMEIYDHLEFCEFDSWPARRKGEDRWLMLGPEGNTLTATAGNGRSGLHLVPAE